MKEQLLLGLSCRLPGNMDLEDLVENYFSPYAGKNKNNKNELPADDSLAKDPALLMSHLIEWAMLDAGIEELGQDAAVFVVLPENSKDPAGLLDDFHAITPPDLTVLHCQNGTESLIEALSWLTRNECEVAVLLALEKAKESYFGLSLVLSSENSAAESKQVYARISPCPYEYLQESSKTAGFFKGQTSIAQISLLQLSDPNWLLEGSHKARNWQELRLSSVNLHRENAAESGAGGFYDPVSFLSTLALELAGSSTSLSTLLSLLVAGLALQLRIYPGSGKLKLEFEPGSPEQEYLLQSERPRPWIHPVSPVEPAEPRMAYLFSESGQFLLSEYGSDLSRTCPRHLKRQSSELFLFSASSSHELCQAIYALLEDLSEIENMAFAVRAESNNKINLGKSAKLNSSEETQQYRLAIVAADENELAALLKQSLDGLSGFSEQSLCEFFDKQITGSGQLFFAGPERLRQEGKIVFVLPGLGASYPRMLEDLCFFFPEVREVFDFVERLALKADDDVVPSRAIFPATQSGSAASSQAALATMDSAVITLLLAEWALYNLLKRLGISADILLGCSTGEFAAITMSEAIDILKAAETFYKLSTLVSRSVTAKDLAELRSIRISAPYEPIVAQLLQSLASELYLSAELSANCVLVSGKSSAVEELCKLLKARGIDFLLLPIAIPYHTPLVSGKISEQDPEVRALTISAPKSEAWSCSDATRYPSQSEALRKVATNLFEKPILLRKTVQRLYQEGARIFLELGPKGGLVPFIRDSLGELVQSAEAERQDPASDSGQDPAEHLVLAANVSNKPAIDQLNTTLAQLFCRGVEMKLDCLYQRRNQRSYQVTKSPESLISDLFQVNSSLDPLFSERSMIADEVMLGYMATMQEFHQNLMETQEKLMLAYLEAEAEDEAESELGELEPAFESLEYGADNETSAVTDDELLPLNPAENFRRLPFFPEPLLARKTDTYFLSFSLSTKNHPFLLDHAIGGAVDSKGTRVYLLPLMVALEIMSEGASLLFPDMSLKRILELRAYKRICCNETEQEFQLELKYESENLINARILRHCANGGELEAEAEVLLSSQLEFAPHLSPPPEAGAKGKDADLEEWRQSRLSPDSLYGEESMFHGPRMQSVLSIDRVGKRQIEGRLSPSSYADWFSSLSNKQFPEANCLVDPLLLDNASQFVLYQMFEAQMPVTALLPFHIESIEFFEGFQNLHEISCNLNGSANLRSMSLKGTLADIEIRLADTETLIKIKRISSRAIVLSERIKDFVHDPGKYLSSQIKIAELDSSIVMRLDLEELPEDETTLDWFSDYVLCFEEKKEWQSLRKEKRRRQWLAGRIAAKEAARLLIQREFALELKAADLLIEKSAQGIAQISVPAYELTWIPQISIAHCRTSAAAVAERPRQERLAGIDLENIDEREDGFEVLALTKSEQNWLKEQGSKDRNEQICILWTAKEAASKACGTGLRNNPKNFELRARESENTNLISALAEDGKVKSVHRCIFVKDQERNLIISVAVD